MDGVQLKFDFHFRNGANGPELESIGIERDGTIVRLHEERQPEPDKYEGIATDEATVKILAFFSPEHADRRLRPIMTAFADSALSMVKAFPSSAERTIALRKLLEARDAAIRAAL